MADLQATIRQVLTLEREVLRDFTATVEIAARCLSAAAVLGSIESTVSGMPAMLADALVRLGGEAGAGPDAGAEAGIERGWFAALPFLSGRMHEAALGCAALHAVAHRAFQSTGEGNLADLAESHALAYLSAAAAIGDAVSDVAVWELEGAGIDCVCRCPSCGVGVCLCARHGKETLAAIRQTATTRPSEAGIAVRQPFAGSAAAQAGLRAGDIIVSAEDTPVDAGRDLQAVIRAAPSGGQVRLAVRRDGELSDMTVLKPA